MVICLERDADLHMAQLMPLPLTVYGFSKIQIGFTFLVPAHRVVPEKGPLNVCVRACVRACVRVRSRACARACVRVCVFTRFTFLVPAYLGCFGKEAVKQV